MEWNIKRSMKVKRKIAENPELMAAMAKKVEAIFKEFKVKFSGMSYVFEPRVFSMNPKEAPEILNRSRAAMLKAILDDLLVASDGNGMDMAIDVSKYRACLPQCGPMDPFSIRILEKLRIRKNIEDDPVPIKTSDQLMRRIVGNKDLMQALSKALFNLLQRADIKFSKKEGCVFTPVVFQSPVYAQKVGMAADISEMRGFGPQLYAFADPTPEPSAVKIKPFPGIIEILKEQTLIPGVIIDRWWWIGIPAPELLQALDVIRKYQ